MTELGDKKYAGFCFLCGTEMFSRTGPEYYLDPECCIPGTNTHNCEIGRLLHSDEDEFDRRSEAARIVYPEDPGPFTEIPADERHGWGIEWPVSITELVWTARGPFLAVGIRG